MRCCLTWLRLDLTPWLVSVSVIAVKESHDFLRMICAQYTDGSGRSRYIVGGCLACLPAVTDVACGTLGSRSQSEMMDGSLWLWRFLASLLLPVSEVLNLSTLLHCSCLWLWGEGILRLARGCLENRRPATLQVLFSPPLDSLSSNMARCAATAVLIFAQTDPRIALRHCAVRDLLVRRE